MKKYFLEKILKGNSRVNARKAKNCFIFTLPPPPIPPKNKIKNGIPIILQVGVTKAALIKGFEYSPKVYS